MNKSSNRIMVIGVLIDPTTYQAVSQKIYHWAHHHESRAINATSVHGLIEAQDDSSFRAVLNNADINTPDGVPVVWMLRLLGCNRQSRVYGPTLMLQIMEMAESQGLPVGFYGSTQLTLDKLISKVRSSYPNLKIVYSYSPPFRPLTAIEEEEIVQDINSSGVRILFVGLGCPRQERWIAAHVERIPAVMVGVGAAFDFHAGILRQAPQWMQNAGLEWFFRLMVEPKRLYKRYLKNNPRFIWLAMLQLLGLRNFPC